MYVWVYSVKVVIDSLLGRAFLSLIGDLEPVGYVRHVHRSVSPVTPVSETYSNVSADVSYDRKVNTVICVSFSNCGQILMVSSKSPATWPLAVRSCSLVGVCVVLLDWGSSNASGSYESASFWQPSLLWREHCAGLEKGLPFWPQISRESKPVSSKGGLPPVIYNPHGDEVRHGHCLCTWAFIKQPGWALCRRHSNVQGAD